MGMISSLMSNGLPPKYPVASTIARLSRPVAQLISHHRGYPIF